MRVRRWLLVEHEEANGISPSHFLANSHSAVEPGWNGTEDERGKVARNASATVRSPVPDEQIREYGRWKYRFRLQATADVLPLCSRYISPSFYPSLFHSFVLRSRMFSVYTAEELVHARTRLFASRRVSTCTCVCIRVCR